jgi:hypothetical protein
VTLWGVARLEALMKRRLPMDHPTLQVLPELVRHTVRVAEVRLQRIGLIDRPLSSLSSGRKLLYVLEAYAGKLASGLLSMVLGVVLFPLRMIGFFRPKRLTDTYLDDPQVRGNLGADAGDDGDGEGGAPIRPRPAPAGA